MRGLNHNFVVGQVVAFDYQYNKSGPRSRHGIVHNVEATGLSQLVTVYDYTATPEPGFRKFDACGIQSLRVLGPVRSALYRFGLHKLALE